MSSHLAHDLALARTAAPIGSILNRARAVLHDLRPAVPVDASWLALAVPRGHGYGTLAGVGPDRPVGDFLAGPSMARAVGATGPERWRPAWGLSELSYPSETPPSWTGWLLPTRIFEALAVALLSAAKPHDGFPALLSRSRQPPSEAVRIRLGRLPPVPAEDIDPMRSLATIGSLVRGATAGVVLRADGGCQAFPGLPVDAMLGPDSPALDSGRKRVDDGHPYSSFLWPVGARSSPERYVRITVLAAPEDVPVALTAVALVSAPPDLRGLTPRELEVLGLLVEGCSNQEIARTLVVAIRTVATHIEHILAKLGTPTRTLAAVHAERDGLYVPSLSAHPTPVSPTPITPAPVSPTPANYGCP